MDKNHGSLNTNDFGSFSGGTNGKEPACQCRRYETQVQSRGQDDPLEKEGNGNPLQYSSLGNSMNRGEIQIGRHEAELSRQFWLEVAGEAITENGLCY